MVEGFQRRRLAVVDLDGTLVAGNTLHEYLRLGWRHGSWRCRVRLAALAALRGARVISHARFKFASLGCIEPTDALLMDFAVRISEMRNGRVEALLREMRTEGVEVLLATAAADVYVPAIWTGEFMATAMPRGPELRGEKKCRAVLDYLRGHDMELYAVLTDHYDDLPLLGAGAARNILVSPSARTLALAAGTPNLEVIE